MRLWSLLIACVVAVAASVLYASSVQRSSAGEHRRASVVVAQLYGSAEAGEAALAALVATGDQEKRQDLEDATSATLANLDLAGKLAAHNRKERAAVATERHYYELWKNAAESDLQGRTLKAAGALLTQHALARHELLDHFKDANESLAAALDHDARGADTRAALVPPLLILGLSVVFGSIGAAMGIRMRRSRGRTDHFQALQGRFAEAMQVCHGQREAHALIKAHLERTLPGTSVTVLNRNNSADRLEISTEVPEDSPLHLGVEHAAPRSCLAVRLNRPFTHADPNEVLSCELCGAVAVDTICHPLLVGGEVIGSVLAERREPLDDEGRRQIGDSVALAAPVLANLRNLAIAELRAATDPLTGLPNRRAVDDTLLRMVALAGRSLEPLSVILLDLDHFKEINDSHGHDRGDEVLAAVGIVLREVVRTSDFAGRSGGEEFVLFLPETDRTGAVHVAEKIRDGMRAIRVGGVDRAITASFGIGCYPADAGDAQTLMRCADRALYAAKRNGRDRIESSSTATPSI